MYIELRLQSGSGLADMVYQGCLCARQAALRCINPMPLCTKCLAQMAAAQMTQGKAPRRWMSMPGPALRRALLTQPRPRLRSQVLRRPSRTLCVNSCDAQPCALRHERATPADEAADDPPQLPHVLSAPCCHAPHVGAIVQPAAGALPSRTSCVHPCCMMPSRASMRPWSPGHSCVVLFWQRAMPEACLTLQ